MSDTQNLSVATKASGSTAVLTASGKVTVTSAPVLEDAIGKAFGDGVTTVRLEMDDVEYISSAGLRVLVQGTKMAHDRDGELVIVHPTEEVTEVFEMTGLVDVFVIE